MHEASLAGGILQLVEDAAVRVRCTQWAATLAAEKSGVTVAADSVLDLAARRGLCG